MSNKSVMAEKTQRPVSAEKTLRLLGLSDDLGHACAAPGILSTVEDIEAIREEWVELSLTSDEPHTHFQSYDWCMNWINHCHDASKEQLSVVPVWKNNRLVAILPLMITSNTGGCRIMSFIGEPLIEYCNILVDKKNVSVNEVVSVWNEVKDTMKVDAFVFNNFPACSSLFDIFNPDKISRSSAQASSIMDLTCLESWDGFRAGMSRSARKSRNRRRRKLEALGTIEYRVFEGGSEGYKDIVRRSKEMKKDWLKETGRNAGDLFSGNTIDTIAHMSGSLQQMHGAIAGGLYVGDKLVAAEVGFVERGKYLSYIGAFDWAMRDYSAGKIQIEEALKWAYENGIKTYDFLGEPSVYKSDWSNDEVALYSCHHGVTLKGKLYAHLWKKNLRPFVKKCFHRLPVSVRKQLMSVLGA